MLHYMYLNSCLNNIPVERFPTNRKIPRNRLKMPLAKALCSSVTKSLTTVYVSPEADPGNSVSDRGYKEV